LFFLCLSCFFLPLPDFLFKDSRGKSSEAVLVLLKVDRLFNFVVNRVVVDTSSIEELTGIFDEEHGRGSITELERDRDSELGGDIETELGGGIEEGLRVGIEERLGVGIEELGGDLETELGGGIETELG